MWEELEGLCLAVRFRRGLSGELDGCRRTLFLCCFLIFLGGVVQAQNVERLALKLIYCFIFLKKAEQNRSHLDFYMVPTRT